MKDLHLVGKVKPPIISQILPPTKKIKLRSNNCQKLAFDIYKY